MPLLRYGLVRTISRALAACELTHLPRQIFELQRAYAQHECYVGALRSAGVDVRILPEEPTLPDSTFVEDPVVVLDEVAILCRLGAASRKVEAELMRREVEPLRALYPIEAPGTLEGGDVLRMGQKLFVGLSSRTNRSGLEQLRGIVALWNYTVTEVEVRGCLHLKTAVTSPAPNLVVMNPAWIDRAAFRDCEILEVPQTEPFGANLLAVNDRVLVTASAPRTAEQLRARKLAVHLVDVSELQKAEAGLTCLSVLYS